MKITILSLCLLAFLFTFSTQTFAVDFTVNVASDQHDPNPDDGICGDVSPAEVGIQCSLRAAVEQANVLASNDRILFNLPFTSTITLSTFNGGEIPINNNGTLEIIGTGTNINGGAGTNRIFFVNGATVTIRGVTLSGGNGNGAAVFANGGTVILEAVVVQNNVGNSSSGFSSGAVYFDGGTNHRIANSTISDNTDFFSCAAFRADDTSLTVVNTTVSDNSTSFDDGGTGAICILRGSATFRNTTIFRNTAGVSDRIGGGGIYNSGATVNLGNTIVAGNSATNGPDLVRVDSTSNFTTSGGNLIGDNTGNPAAPNTTAFPTGNPNANGDKVGTGGSVINPLLGPLKNNGGPTPTRALLAGSPAIDSGINTLATAAGLTTDQRGAGFPRISDGDGNGTATVDIGAFEVQLAPTAATVSVSGRVMTSAGRGIVNVRLTLTDSNGQIRTATTTSFGYYRFDDVQAGETYILSATGKHYTFSQPLQVLNINEETNAVNFIADSKKSVRAF